MTAKMAYKGYEIVAKPFQVRGEEKWTCDISIYKYRGDRVTEKPFYSSNAYASEQEAKMQSLKFGQLLIDGQIKNCTIDDL